MLSIVSRSEWGARAPKSTAPWPVGAPSSWTFHYEGSDIPIDQPDYSGVVRAIQHYHMDISPEHYADIAYNFLVAPDGDVFEGRGWNVRSGANGSAISNQYSAAVCYLGGPNTPLTDAAKRGFAELVAVKPMSHWPHRHWFNTACPGSAVLDWMAAGEPVPGAATPPATLPTGAQFDMPVLLSSDAATWYLVTDKYGVITDPSKGTNLASVPRFIVALTELQRILSRVNA